MSTSSRCRRRSTTTSAPTSRRWCSASETLGKVLKKGDVVVYESTVYPGCTEEVCVPILEKVSGLKFNKDFFAGYSPERINPGDKQHRLPTHPQGHLRLDAGSGRFRRRALRARIITAGTHKASSIKRGRGRQGHREHAARREHRADQRAGADLQPPRHRHRRSAAGRRHQVELPAVPPGPGRRPLHRRRSLLPDAQGAGDRLPPGDDPRRAPPQRQHGRSTWPGEVVKLHDRQAHPREGRARAGAWA